MAGTVTGFAMSTGPIPARRNNAVDGVTLKQFNLFIDAKAPEKPCPECSTNHWNVISNPMTDEAAPEDAIVFKGFIFAGGGGFVVYPMYCDNCGFTKNFAAGTVEDWVENNG
jgi:hypothetical protein